MNYQDIQKVNGEIKTIDLKGKEYASVAERVTAFRKLFPDNGYITTEIVEHDGTTVLMKAEAGYRTENGIHMILGTGYAQEVRGKGMVNGTSYIENCETSAVGRALGFLGLGISGGICSADEYSNATDARNKEELAQISELRTDILLAYCGKTDVMCADIQRLTSGKSNTLDDLTIVQLVGLRNYATKMYAKMYAKMEDKQ